MPHFQTTFHWVPLWVPPYHSSPEMAGKTTSSTTNAPFFNALHSTPPELLDLYFVLTFAWLAFSDNSNDNSNKYNTYIYIYIVI